MSIVWSGKLGCKVLFCGDRNWGRRDDPNDPRALEENQCILQSLYAVKPISIIEGEARGADSIARFYAEDVMKIPVFKFPAQWEKYGRAAGVIRNQQMLDEGKPELVLAFHRDISKSKGTADMVKRARRAKIETIIISSMEDVIDFLCKGERKEIQSQG